jgi:RNA polymerase sigma-70 factor (ECF subfamily)
MNRALQDRDADSTELTARNRLPTNANAEVMLTLLAPMLSRVARRYEGDSQRCSELQQEMLIAIWISLDTCERRSSFRTWVHSVAHNVGVQHIAERLRNRREARLNGTEEIPLNPYDPEALVAVRERAQTMLGLLGGLRQRERELVLLDLQEFDVSEMSAAMKLSQAQVRDTLGRARRRLMLWMKRTDLHDAPARSAFDHLAEAEPFSRYAPRASARFGGSRNDSVYVIARSPK